MIVGRVHRRLLGELRVELTGVVIALQQGFVRWFVAFVIDICPVQVLKERVTLAKRCSEKRTSLLLLARYLDLFGIFHSTAQPMADLSPEELRRRRKMFFEYRPMINLVLLIRLSSKRNTFARGDLRALWNASRTRLG